MLITDQSSKWSLNFNLCVVAIITAQVWKRASSSCYKKAKFQFIQNQTEDLLEQDGLEKNKLKSLQKTSPNQLKLNKQHPPCSSPKKK